MLEVIGVLLFLWLMGKVSGLLFRLAWGAVKVIAILLLAAALPNPRRYRVQPPSPYVQQRSAWIRRQMGQLGQATLNKVYKDD